jgi:hypothetical protein
MAIGVIAFAAAPLFLTPALADGPPRYGGEAYTGESHQYERVEPRYQRVEPRYERVEPRIVAPRIVEEPVVVYPPVIVRRPVVVARPIIVSPPSVVVEPGLYAYGPGVRNGHWRHRGHFRDGY